MKKETLERANSLQKRIDDLREHISYVEVPIKNGVSYTELEGIPSGNSYNNRRLRTEFYPFSTGELVELYLSRAEKKLARLEKELEDLRD